MTNWAPALLTLRALELGWPRPQMIDDVRNSVMRAIEMAFADNPYPADKGLLHPQCMDDEDIRDFYGRTTWLNIPGEVIDRNNASLCFFSPEAYRFYLPAYLIWALRNFDSSDSFTVDSTIYSLTPGEGDLRRFSLSKFALLDVDQRRAVLDFLKYLAEHGGGMVDQHAVQKAIAYWSSVQ